MTQPWAILLDARLSREARIMGAHLHFMGAGDHKVSTEDWQRLLGASRGGPPKRQSIAGWAAELELYGYVAKRSGGVGSPIFTVPQEDGKGKLATVPQRDGSRSTVPQGDTLQSSRRTVEPHVVVVEDVVVGDVVEDARERRYSLDPRVREILDAPDGDAPALNGCRGAVVDYLEGRVMGPSQVGYVRSIQAWLRGGSGTPRGLLDVSDPVHIIATALNDLLTEDETKYKSGRGQVGVIANLRAKLSVLIAQELAPARHSRSPDPTPAQPKHRTREVYVEQ